MIPAACKSSTHSRLNWEPQCALLPATLLYAISYTLHVMNPVCASENLLGLFSKGYCRPYLHCQAVGFAVFCCLSIRGLCFNCKVG